MRPQARARAWRAHGDSRAAELRLRLILLGADWHRARQMPPLLAQALTSRSTRYRHRSQQPVQRTRGRGLQLARTRASLVVLVITVTAQELLDAARASVESMAFRPAPLVVLHPQNRAACALLAITPADRAAASAKARASPAASPSLVPGSAQPAEAGSSSPYRGRPGAMLARQERCHSPKCIISVQRPAAIAPSHWRSRAVLTVKMASGRARAPAPARRT